MKFPEVTSSNKNFIKYLKMHIREGKVMDTRYCKRQRGMRTYGFYFFACTWYLVSQNIYTLSLYDFPVILPTRKCRCFTIHFMTFSFLEIEKTLSLEVKMKHVKKYNFRTRIPTLNRHRINLHEGA